MDKELQELLKAFLQDYIDNGLIVKVNLNVDESAGMALRMDLLEKAISDGLKDVGDSICASVSDKIGVTIPDEIEVKIRGGLSND